MENASLNAMHQHRYEGDEYRRIEMITGAVRRLSRCTKLGSSSFAALFQ
jgi:hypothetical protein